MFQIEEMPDAFTAPRGTWRARGLRRGDARPRRANVAPLAGHSRFAQAWARRREARRHPRRSAPCRIVARLSEAWCRRPVDELRRHGREPAPVPCRYAHHTRSMRWRRCSASSGACCRWCRKHSTDITVARVDQLPSSLRHGIPTTSRRSSTPPRSPTTCPRPRPRRRADGARRESGRRSRRAPSTSA